MFVTVTDWYSSYKLPVELWEPSSLPLDNKKDEKGQSRDNFIILAINSKYKRRWINVICCRINTILMQCLKYMNIRHKSEERLGEPGLYPSFKHHTHTCTLYILRRFINIVYIWQRSVWRYQRGNQNRISKNRQHKCCQVYSFLRVHSDCHLQSDWPPLNIVEIGITHQQLTTIVADLVKFSKKWLTIWRF